MGGAAEGEESKEGARGFLFLGLFLVLWLRVLPRCQSWLCDLDEIIALYESWEQSLDVSLYVNFF